MTIHRLFNKIVSTKRLQASGGHKELWASNLSEVYCSIQPIGKTSVSFTQGGFFNEFNMWCENSVDIKVGDRVIDGEIVYNVKGVRNMDFGNNASNHLSILLVKGL